jgi:hypothetical protein
VSGSSLSPVTDYCNWIGGGGGGFVVSLSIYTGMNRPTLNYAMHNQLSTSLDDKALEVETVSLYNQITF